MPIAIASRSCSSASGGPEREHDRLAAVRLDEPDRLLDAALLVRADGEAEVARVDARASAVSTILPPVIGTRLTQTRIVHQDRIRVFSGSKSGVEPTTATVTG